MDFLPFGFGGGLYDAETGLVRFGYRDYDPVIGHWTSPNPILHRGGQVNFYAYLNGDPVNRRDPPGLFWGCTDAKDLKELQERHDDERNDCSAVSRSEGGGEGGGEGAPSSILAPGESSAPTDSDARVTKCRDSTKKLNDARKDYVEEESNPSDFIGDAWEWFADLF